MLVLIVTGAGDYFLKKSAVSSHYYSSPYFIVGIIIYILLAFLWAIMYRTMDMSIMNIYYGLGIAFVFIVIGIFAFGEVLTPTRIIGLCFGLIAIFFLNK